jgi:hypothetical protein
MYFRTLTLYSHNAILAILVATHMCRAGGAWI